MAERSVWKQGAIVGLIGAISVAIWFFILDLVMGRPLFTPAMLGSAFFLGVRDLDLVEITLGIVLGYTVFHILVFALLGALVVFVIRRVRSAPPLLLGALLVFVVFQALFTGLLAIAAEGVLFGAMAWWAIGVGNLLAAISMGYYIWEKDPALQEAVSREPFESTG